MDNTSRCGRTAPIGLEAKLKEKGLKSRIHRKGYRNKPAERAEKRGNTTRSNVRARVELGAQTDNDGCAADGTW